MYSEQVKSHFVDILFNKSLLLLLLLLLYWNGWTILEWIKRALIVKCDCLNELILTAVYNNIVFMFPKLSTGRNTALSMITSVNIKLQVLFHEIVRDLHKFCWWHTGNR
jgi:hypothetical protein